MANHPLPETITTDQIKLAAASVGQNFTEEQAAGLTGHLFAECRRTGQAA